MEWWEHDDKQFPCATRNKTVCNVDVGVGSDLLYYSRILLSYSPLIVNEVLRWVQMSVD